MKKDLTLYLAHPFDNRKAIREWELGFEKRTEIKLLNPFYDTQRTDIEKIDAGRNERYEKIDPIELVERDLFHIKSSDGILAFITGAISYGTLMEIAYNKMYQSSKREMENHPAYLIITNGHQNHPWLAYHADKRFPSVVSFEKWISRDCNFCDGKMHIVGSNEDMKFDMYQCNKCQKSWMEPYQNI